MVMMNYLVLENDKPTQLHFTDHLFADRMVYDRDMGKEKPVRSLVFWVDEVDASPVFKTFSILSPRLAALFEPYLFDSRFRDYDFLITKRGGGYLTTWSLEATPRPAHKV